MTLIHVSGSAKNQYIAAISVNILAFCHGCAIGWLSPVLPLLTSEENSPLGKPLDTEMMGWVASAICISGAIGTPFFGMAADRIGRKTSIMISAIPYQLSWLLLLFWRTPTSILVGRLLAGCGGAGIFMLTSQYASEISSRETRGMLSSLMIFSINGGIIFMFTLQGYVTYATSLIIMSFVPLTALIMLWKMPETPAFLVKMGRTGEALKALAWLRSLPEENQSVKEELNNLKYDIELANSNNKHSEMSNPIMSKATRRALLINFGLLTVQVFTGIFAIISFSSQIFSEAGSNLSTNLATVILGVAQFLGSVVASSLIEKLGRKVLLILSTMLMCISLSIAATYFYVKQLGFEITSFSLIPVVSLSVAVFTFAIGIGPVPYVLLSEIFVVQVRGTVNSIVFIWVWSASFLISLLYLSAVKLLGISIVFYIFSLIAFLGTLLTIFCLPETKGKSLEDVICYFNGGKPVNIQSQMEGEKMETF